MPKRRVRNLDGVRIEFNETERAAIEMFAAANAAGTILSGLGAVLAPFQGSFTALTVAFIAETGIKAILEPTIESGKVVLGHVERVLVEGPVDLERGSLIDKELNWWQKIVLKGAGYEW